MQDALFSSKKLTIFISRRPQKHKGRQSRWDCFSVKIKQIKRSAVRYMLKFLFPVHTITEAKQSNGQSGATAGAMAVDLPVRLFHLAHPVYCFVHSQPL